MASKAILIWVWVGHQIAWGCFGDFLSHFTDIVFGGTTWFTLGGFDLPISFTLLIFCFYFYQGRCTLCSLLSVTGGVLMGWFDVEVCSVWSLSTRYSPTRNSPARFSPTGDHLTMLSPTRVLPTRIALVAVLGCGVVGERRMFRWRSQGLRQ